MLLSSFLLAEAFPSESAPGYNWVVYYASGANPDGKKGVWHACLPTGMQPLLPPHTTHAGIAILNNRSSALHCCAVRNKLPSLGTMSQLSRPRPHLTELPLILFIGRPRGRPYTNLHEASSSNTTSPWLNLYKSYSVTMHTARSLCDSCFEFKKRNHEHCCQTILHPLGACILQPQNGASCEAKLYLTQTQCPYFTYTSQGDLHIAFFLFAPSKLLLLTRLPEDQD